MAIKTKLSFAIVFSFQEENSALPFRSFPALPAFSCCAEIPAVTLQGAQREDFPRQVCAVSAAIGGGIDWHDDELTSEFPSRLG